ncbi:MAG: hypothetical protein AAF773_26740 [Cyanobacteria bacterium P01_D01_bin.115]
MMHRWLLTAFITGLMGGGLAAVNSSTSLAHEVQIADDVGATLHIEPDDVPLAGAPTTAWFALTQAGGTVIPLDQCNCRLTLYDNDTVAVETPLLTPISAEGFTDIPSAVVTFPEVGAYELVLQGSPQGDVEFSPFELRFEVVVAGRATPPASNPATETENSVAETENSVAETTEAETTEADATQADAADSATAPSEATEPTPNSTAETPASVASSNTWRSVTRWGGAVLVIGLIAGIISGLRSPGEKS